MSKSGIDVSIIVVSYNTLALTRAALDAVVRETTTTRYEIVAVDNASSDGSAEMLATHASRPRVIALNENIGFARANNLAAERAEGRYILLLNPDTVVLEHAIDRLVAFAKERPDARIWGGRTVFGDGRLNPSSCWSRMTLWNQLCRASGLTGLFPNSAIFNGEAFGGWQRDSVRGVDIVSGCFLLIEAALWRELSGFDRRFFMYGEEADLCLRAQRLGAKPVVTPEATIVHYGGASERTRADKMVRLLSAKASLIDRHWHPMLQAPGRVLLAAWPLTRAIATTLVAGCAPAGSPKVETAVAWRTIWSRRAEWFSGYRQPTSAPALSERSAA